MAAKFIGKIELRELTGGLSDTTIWRMEKAGSFPRRVKISLNRVAWSLAEFEKWAADPSSYRSDHMVEGKAS